MAIDFQQIYERIKEIGQSVQARQETLDNRRRAARALFEAYANDLDGLRAKLDSALQQDENIRCAYPLDEGLDTHVPPQGSAMGTLIAADGSQIVPNRQDAELFGLVNVGAIVMELNSGKTPKIFTDSELIYGDELFIGNSIIGEGEISLRRDTAERIMLSELAKTKLSSSPVITFMDGPIALWGSRDSEKETAYRNSLEKYKEALYDLEKNDVVLAGYIDKPAASPVVSLLQIMQTDINDIKKLRTSPPWIGVSDRWLFGGEKKPLLKSGERSAIFALQSKATNKDYTGSLAIHFFYLNVGTEKHPYIVRVEVPKWVADDDEKINNLHAVLVQQAKVLGGKPYPYLLHRSHEIAVVSRTEKCQIQKMMAKEFGIHGEEGAKQVAKGVNKDC